MQLIRKTQWKDPLQVQKIARAVPSHLRKDADCIQVNESDREEVINLERDQRISRVIVQVIYQSVPFGWIIREIYQKHRDYFSKVTYWEGAKRLGINELQWVGF